MPRNENDLLRWGDIVNALYNYHKSTPANRAFGMAEIRAVLHQLEFVEKVGPENLRPLFTCKYDGKWCFRGINGKLASDVYGNYWGEAVDRLAEYENADVEGRMIVLPCKIGDTVWAIRNFKGNKHPQLGVVSEMYFCKDMTLQIVVKYIGRGEFGKTIFHTLEEAKQALKGASDVF